MPRNQYSFCQGDKPKQAQADQCKKENTSKCQIGSHVSGNNLDIEAKAFVSSDKFGNCGAYSSVDGGVFEADKTLGQSSGQSDLQKRTPSPCTG